MQTLNTDLVGHSLIRDFFAKAIEHNRLSHAYLFVGAHGIGKTTAAQWFAKQYVGDKGFQHPDVHKICRLKDEKTGKMKSAVSIEQIRSLKQIMSMTSFIGGKKLAFIEDAEYLNASAANALLKTLEEPTKDTVLILRAAHQKQLPQTIVSRCQIIRFSRVPTLEIEEALRKKGCAKKDALQLAHLSAGLPGVAFSLFMDSQKRAEHDVAVSQIQELLSQSLAARIRLLQEFFGKSDALYKEKMINALDKWETVLRDVFLLSTGCDDLVIYQNEKQHLQAVSNTKQTEHWLNVLETLKATRTRLLQNANPHLAMEHFIFTI